MRNINNISDTTSSNQDMAHNGQADLGDQVNADQACGCMLNNECNDMNEQTEGSDIRESKTSDLVKKINAIWVQIECINNYIRDGIARRNESDCGDEYSVHFAKIEELLIKKRNYGIEHSREMIKSGCIDFQKHVMGHLRVINDYILGGVLDLSNSERSDFSDAELMALEYNFEYCIECEEIEKYAVADVDGELDIFNWRIRTLNKHRHKLLMCLLDYPGKSAYSGCLM